MRILMLTINIVLIAYVVWEVVDFIPRYRQLKLALSAGDTGARRHVYWRALAFEWISALLALGALEFNWNQLNPKFLDLDSMGLIQSLSQGGAFPTGVVAGVLGGIVAGTLGFVIARMKANRRGTPPPQDVPLPRWRKLLPDFFALLPVTIHERLLWAAVAISAGVCEEVVFRGWLLAMLHGHVELGGTRLILVAAIVFGLAHVYQGITGVILTAFAGAFFCVLYIATGSLLVPILLHSLVDVRFAFMPAPRLTKARASFA
jgi:membrane protease YdiL (CAAX protease family)